MKPWLAEKPNLQLAAFNWRHNDFIIQVSLWMTLVTHVAQCHRCLVTHASKKHLFSFVSSVQIYTSEGKPLVLLHRKTNNTVKLNVWRTCKTLRRRGKLCLSVYPAPNLHWYLMTWECDSSPLRLRITNKMHSHVPLWTWNIMQDRITDFNFTFKHLSLTDIALNQFSKI